MKYELRAVELCKSYRKRQVVRSVSLHLRSGEIVGLLGPNGAGKTSVFYMLIGLVTPDSGRIFKDEQDISSQLMHKRTDSGIGYLPQEASIFRGLSVEDNIRVGLEVRKDMSKRDRADALEKLLNEFQLQDVRTTLGLSLSSGERRRAEIARALSGNPTFILLDEPFAGVDPISIHEIQKLIRDLQRQGIGLLITDHNVRETLRICDRAYIMSAGEIIATGDMESILHNETVKKVYLGNEFAA